MDGKSLKTVVLEIAIHLEISDFQGSHQINQVQRTLILTSHLEISPSKEQKKFLKMHLEMNCKKKINYFIIYKYIVILRYNE
jgi:hypothetical protein